MHDDKIGKNGDRQRMGNESVQGAIRSEPMVSLIEYQYTI